MKHLFLLIIFVMFTGTAYAQDYGGEPPMPIAACVFCQWSLIAGTVDEDGEAALHERAPTEGYHTVTLMEVMTTAWQQMRYYDDGYGNLSDFSNGTNGIYDMSCFVNFLMCRLPQDPQ